MKIFKMHKHWAEVEKICQTLKKAGFKAVLAGGCVRDGLLNRLPMDFDVATNASPDQVEQLFPKSLAIGKAFGVIKVIFEDFQVEVATFRSDGPYQDGRRPSHVVFSDMKEDALRRDFTVNALFYSIDKEEIIDFVNGREDLRAGIIRTVGDPRERFEEDKLRPLRAVRFSAQLNFIIEESTWEAIKEFAPRVTVVSPERIQDELKKLFKQHGQWTGLKGLIESGIMDQILPELREWNDKKPMLLLEALTRQLHHCPDFALSLARLFLSRKGLLLFWPEVEPTLRRLKCSNDVIQDVLYYLKAIAVLEEGEQARLAARLRLIGHEKSPLLLEMWSAWRLVTKQSMIAVDDLIQSFQKIADGNGFLPKPFINGEDLIRSGKQKGPLFKALLQELYDEQLEGLITSREEALARLP